MLPGGGGEDPLGHPQVKTLLQWTECCNFQFCFLLTKTSSALHFVRETSKNHPYVGGQRLSAERGLL